MRHREYAEYQAGLRAIRETPWDDLPRLTLCDRLEEWDEEGSNAEAAMIRESIAHPENTTVLPPGVDGTVNWISPTAFPYQWADPSRTIEYAIETNFYKIPICYGIAGVSLAFNRGFISEAHLSLAAFVGLFCIQCTGTGQLATTTRAINNAISYKSTETCPNCSGKGSVGSVAKELFEAHPIEKVILTDAVIRPSMGNDSYFVGSLGSFPQKYWRRLDDFRNDHAARVELAQVCVDFGREEAGLTPIRRNPPAGRLTSRGN